jgi:hypothetical protein
MALFSFKTEIPKNKLFAPQGPEILFKATVSDFFQDTGAQATSIAKQETPKGATGRLADSVKFSRVGFLNAKVEWTAGHARPVTDGTRPHFAPIQPLSEWTAVKWGSYGDGTVLQEIISRRGTRPNKFPARTKKRVEEVARRLWPEKIRNFVRRLLT